MEFQDKVLTCIDCGAEFVFTAGEQLFFHDKQFKNEPKRCKTCKSKRVAVLTSAPSPRGEGRHYARVETRATCSQCGKETTVPFRREHRDRKSTRLNSSHANISYAVFCLKKKKNALCPRFAARYKHQRASSVQSVQQSEMLDGHVQIDYVIVSGDAEHVAHIAIVLSCTE